MKSKARYAAYEILLNLSRNAFATLRKNEELNTQFRLAVLHPTTNTAVAADDDDAPISAVPGEPTGPTPAAATTTPISD